MGSCAAPSAKDDYKFTATDYLQQYPKNSLGVGYFPFSRRTPCCGNLLGEMSLISRIIEGPPSIAQKTTYLNSAFKVMGRPRQ
ncbi:hypothetical protein DAE35_22000 [Salmonella enterica]|uniref:Uncharacterized protein n=3 Tax=Salmonella enterica TaxID=28901 RepID=A0A5V0B9D0_SALEN|nr:hypothetical protein [Salmonella enterica]EBR9811208.1 hypothetical protein [Salmonella enterica subsp. enterica serovar Teshie]EBS5459127.1 hypothetical protein [Salmonella enterica subsp. enterica serovar Enteritidis]ECA1251922.1 hypothetical protein [Salmonella enterica subsp. enterica serovar Chailey]ECA7542323.1 hypothetical protein [Salmonella enterica subsp. enterica serovar Strasbourg]ECD6621406.1 hypothetical protein [Salmonella enterica subsp. enterica]ECZ5471611.1 hypothetical p